MAEVKILCPQCGGRFTLRAPDLQAMASKSFRCPKCGFSAPFGQLMANAGHAQPTAPSFSSPLHTHIGGAPNMGGGFSGKTAVHTQSGLAQLEVMGTGRTFPLSQGVYTLGRDSVDSRASLKIAPDKFMSRLQARLQISSVNGSANCQIIGISATNPVFVNSSRLEPDQVVKLKNGDIILLGMTKVKIKF